MTEIIKPPPGEFSTLERKWREWITRRLTSGTDPGHTHSDLTWTDYSGSASLSSSGTLAYDNVTFSPYRYRSWGQQVEIQLAVTFDITSGTGAVYVSLPVAAAYGAMPILSRISLNGADAVAGCCYIQAPNYIACMDYKNTAWTVPSTDNVIIISGFYR